MATINLSSQLSSQLRPQVTALADGEIAVFSTDLKGEITSCNQAALRMFGCSHEEVLGQTLTALISAEVDSAKPIALQDLLTTALKNGECRSSISRRAADGRSFTIELTITPMRDGGSAPAGMIAMFSAAEERSNSASALQSSQEHQKTHPDEAAPVSRQIDGTDFILASPLMHRFMRMVERVDGYTETVLITGETGTGKELAARSLHLASQRRHSPWVAVNCSALPENLLEAELFGHVRGAFTGALQNRVGRFEQAQGGTLFLDEIGDLDLALQAKLLRVIQEREFERLGSSETVPLNVRLVAATNRDLPQRVAEGRFREDLYYRLNVVPIHMPALRQRRDDIPRLAAHFVEKICRLEEIPSKILTSRAIQALCEYSWPGNVRQLDNLLEMAVALSGTRELLDTRDFPLPAAPALAVLAPGPAISLPDQGMDYQRTVASIERSIIEQALQKTGGNKKAAADMLGLKRTTLSAKVRSFEPGTLAN